MFLYVEWKRVGREQTSLETERERERPLLRKGCGVGNKLDHWSSYLRGLGKG
jgi:hypothetical protein